MSDENLDDIPRNESALTVENVKKYEETTSPVDVVELMQKGIPGTNFDEQSVSHESVHTHSSVGKVASEDASCNTIDDPDLPIQSNILEGTIKQPQEASNISEGEIRQGIRYNGDEYTAISVNVQTDESWLLPLKQSEEALSIVSEKYVSGSSADDSNKSESSISKHTEDHHGKHITTDISIPTDQEEYDHEEKENPLSSLISSLKYNNDVFALGDDMVPTEEIEEDISGSVGGSDKDGANPVTEVSIDLQSESINKVMESENVLSGVGLPYILAYKSETIESKEIDVSNDDILSSNMSWQDLSLDEQKHYNLLFGDISEIQKASHPDDPNELISIEPHPAYGTQEEKKAVKERTVDKLKSQEVERQRQIAASQNQTNFYTFARALKTVNYALSSEKCLEEGWTIKPVSPPPTPQPALQYFFEDLNSNITGTQRYRKKFIQKKYDNGKLFLVVFHDGTGNVWYQSGNLAISIFSSQKSSRLSFLIHEDKGHDENPRVLASFDPSGDCTCYNQDGTILVNLTAFGGSLFNASGNLNKQWKWRDKEQHVHAPPFQPVTFSLTKNFGIRILAQEQIYVTFSDERKNARFNVGTKLRLKQSLPVLEPINPEQAILNERVTYVRSLVERMNNILKFPRSPRSNKIGLPNYLASKVKQPPQLNVSSSLDTFQFSRKKTTIEARQSKRRLKQIKSMETSSLTELKAVVIVN